MFLQKKKCGACGGCGGGSEDAEYDAEFDLDEAEDVARERRRTERFARRDGCVVPRQAEMNTDVDVFDDDVCVNFVSSICALKGRGVCSAAERKRRVCRRHSISCR